MRQNSVAWKMRQKAAIMEAALAGAEAAIGFHHEGKECNDLSR
ncbi:MAG: hypothetical protein ACLTLQ_15975 [[Clostridium] scindens]